MQDAFNYILYGTETSATDLQSFMHHLLDTNAQLPSGQKTPICIWGKHGIGKTDIVAQVAEQRHCQWVEIAAAQFEEMGDLVGMPKIAGDHTIFVPPAWVPTKPGPGILLIDDVNRADDRILRGIMQLLQNYRLISWALPDQWDIVLTANPDGGDYSVTPMDDAMLTRMMHVTLTFDAKNWALWAEQQGIDSRGINYVLTHPELVTGKRTTPRSLVQFFRAIASIDNLGDHLARVQMLADACLDAVTTQSFMTFVQNGYEKLIHVEEIINAKNFTKVENYLSSNFNGSILRVDILATLATRMINHLELHKTKLSVKQIDNIKRFLMLDFMPCDLRLTTAQDLVRSSNKHLGAIMTDPEIGKLLLENM